MNWKAGLERTGNELGGGGRSKREQIGRRCWSKLGIYLEGWGLERTGNGLGGGGWSELGKNWEAGVGANWG